MGSRWRGGLLSGTFTSRRNGDFDLYAVHADGWDAVRLTRDPWVDFRATWSPDGTRIAFWRLREDDTFWGLTTDRDGNREVYVMNADGSNPVNVTNHPSSDEKPVWGAPR